MDIFHNIASALLFVILVYSLGCFITIVFSFFVNIRSRPQNFFRTCKRAVLRPSFFLRSWLESSDDYYRDTHRRPLYVVILILLALLCGLEGYRFSGLDLIPGHYTEYPYAKAGYYIFIQRTGDGTKYYQLPAQLKRTEEGDHILTRAWWPNGGYLSFQGDAYDDGPAVELNKEQIVYDQNDEEWAITLTDKPAEHSEITYTRPGFSVMTLAGCLSVFYFILGLFPFKFPLYRYADEYTTEELSAQ